GYATGVLDGCCSAARVYLSSLRVSDGVIDVLVDSEFVFCLVLVLYGYQSGVILSVRYPYSIIFSLAHEIDVNTTRQGFNLPPKIARPSYVPLTLRGVHP